MDRTPEQQRLREQYVLALIQATLSVQQEAPDREVALELLIEAADLLKQRLQAELQEFREEAD
jgi:hypothetical protein